MMCETSSVASLMVVQNRPGRDESGRTDREVLSGLVEPVTFHNEETSSCMASSRAPSSVRCRDQRHLADNAWRLRGRRAQSDGAAGANPRRRSSAARRRCANAFPAPAASDPRLYRDLAGRRTTPGGAAEEEPLYGDTYLPRKFKNALCTPDDNSVDVLANDIGIIALFEGDELVGYNLVLGGGLGMTHNKPETYPRLATLTAFVEPDDLVRAVEAVIRLQRDHGDRSDRKRARLKYLIDDKGLDWIKSAFEGYFGGPLAEPRAMPPLRVVDHIPEVRRCSC